MQRSSASSPPGSRSRAPASVREALDRLALGEAERFELLEAVREALRGRGAARREAEEILARHAGVEPYRLIPLVLAVRDGYRREENPPRGLSGRVDRVLGALVEGAEARRQAEEGGEALPAGPRGVPSERSGALLRGLLDLAPDAVLTVREKGGVGLWSRAAARLTGRRRREIVGDGIASVFADPAFFPTLLGDLGTVGELEPRETRIRRPDGEEIPVRVFAARLDLAPVRENADTTLVFLHDLTEVHRIRSRLIDTEKLSAMAKIAGSVAHEFRNPLNSLFLSTDLLEDELEGNQESRDAIAPTLAAIREEIERLNQIINHYLSLSKVASHAPEVLDLGRLVTEFAEEWREQGEERDIELRVRVHDGDLAVSADPNQVRRVLVNLVENAFDALDETGDAEPAERPRPAAVTLGVRPMRRTVKLTVKDNGPGIPEEVRERVFEPFFTSKSRGSGLGLYLVREILLSHGGAISLQSTGGRGTSVAMHWPRIEGTR